MAYRILMLLVVCTVGCASQTKLRDLREERDEARQGLASALQALELYEELYGPLPSEIGGGPGPPQWKVLEVREKRAVISAGSEDGVHAGDVLSVVRAKATYLGEVRLLVADKNISMGEFLPGLSEASMICTEGDLVYPDGGGSSR